MIKLSFPSLVLRLAYDDATALVTQRRARCAFLLSRAASALVALLLVVSAARAQVSCPVSSQSEFQSSISAFTSDSADIPGVAFGPNAQGQDRVWVGAYCGLSCGNAGCCQWSAGSIVEIHPTTAQVMAERSSPSGGWNLTGPAGLAHDQNGYLWVAGYNNKKLYKVRLSDGTVVQTISTPNESIGGLGIDRGHGNRPH